MGRDIKLLFIFEDEEEIDSDIVFISKIIKNNNIYSVVKIIYSSENELVMLLLCIERMEVFKVLNGEVYYLR